MVAASLARRRSPNPANYAPEPRRRAPEALGPPPPFMYFDYFNALVFAAVGFVFVFANMVIGSVI